MIIVDYSSMVMSSILGHHKEVIKQDDAESEKLIRHVILATLLNLKKKYGRQYGELLIACDGRDYWRKGVFPYYKGNRKKNREASDIPWALIFRMMSLLKEELVQTFPFRLIEVRGAEADDIIAVLVEHLQSNELIQTGLIEDAQPIMIISSDHDMNQLQRFGDVKQWSPITKKMIEPFSHAKMIEHVVKGDSGDGVPNILSSDDVLITDGVRQKSVTKVRLLEFIEKGRAACRNDNERRNWDRNEQLVDFRFIPETLKDAIYEAIDKSLTVKRTVTPFTYLMKHRCQALIDLL